MSIPFTNNNMIRKVSITIVLIMVVTTKVTMRVMMEVTMVKVVDLIGLRSD